MQRRTFLKTVGASLIVTPAIALAGGNSLDQSGAAEQATGGNKRGELEPYIEVGPFADDKNRVFLFYAYTCPYCAQYAPAIVDWGKTLPREMQLVRVPVITVERLSQVAAAAYYVVREIAPERVNEFDSIAYDTATSGSLSPEIFTELLHKMGISPKLAQETLNKKITKDRMVRATLLSSRYRVTATPHFGIGGRFATNVNFTNGNYMLLMKLLNGLVSQAVTVG